MVRRLQQFHQRFGHFRVFRSWPEDPELGEWVIKLRSNYRFRRLSAARMRDLDAIGFHEPTLPMMWERQYRKLCKIKDELGHCRFQQKHDPSLYAWYKLQEKNFDRLSDEQQSLLHKIDAFHEAK